MQDSNVFDDSQLIFRVLVNDRLEYSLWPTVAGLPTGWAESFGPASYEACASWLELHWQHLRPFGLLAKGGDRG